MRWLRTALLPIGIGLTAGACDYVSGVSVVNDTGVPLVVEADFSSPVRMAVSNDCYETGLATQPPARITLQAGQRVCFRGPAGESSPYELSDRVRSLQVQREGVTCLRAGPRELSGRYRNDGRNAPAQNALHIDDGWCPARGAR